MVDLKELKKITKVELEKFAEDNSKKINEICKKVRDYAEKNGVNGLAMIPTNNINRANTNYCALKIACKKKQHDILDKMLEYVYILHDESDVDIPYAVYQLYLVHDLSRELISDDNVLKTVVIFVLLLDKLKESSKTANNKKEKTVVNNNRASHHCNCDCHSQKTKDKSKKKNNIDFKSALKWLENNVAFGNITVSEQEAITLFNFFNSKQVRELVSVHGVHPLPNGIWWTRLQQYNPTNLKYAFAAPCGDGTMSIVLMFDPNTMDWVFTKEFSNMLA